MSVSRVITSMSLSSIGLIFAAASIWSLTASVHHIRVGSVQDAATTAAVGLFLLYPIFTLVRHDRRGRLLGWLSRGILTRAVAVVLAALAIAVVVAAAGFVAWLRPDTAAGVNGVALTITAGVVVLLLVTSFIYPGFAYDPFRPEVEYFYEPESWSLLRTFGFLDREDVIEPGRLHQILAVVGALGFFGIPLLGWYGNRYAPFLPAQEATEWVAANGFYLGVGVFVVLATTVALYPAATGRWFRNWRVGFKLTLIIAMALPAWFAPSALSRGLPSLTAGWFSREAGAAEVVMIEPIAYARDHGCDRAALALPVATGASPVQICNIPEGLWQELAPGEFLLLSGWKTSWGLNYLAYAVNN